MRKLLIIILSALSLTAFAQQQKKVAVYVVDKSAISAQLADYVTRSLINTRRYILVERDEAFISNLAKEYAYQRSGRVDDSKISRIGRQYGVDCICLVRTYKIGASYCISGRLVDITTANTLTAATGIINGLTDSSGIKEWLKVLTSPSPEKNPDAVKIGVFVNNYGNTELADMVCDIATAIFMNNEDFYLVDRNICFQKQLDEEMAYQRSGNVDNHMISSLGKQWGVDVICSIFLNNDKQSPSITGRLINIETANIYASIHKTLNNKSTDYFNIWNAAYGLYVQYINYDYYKRWESFCELWQRAISKIMEHPTEDSSLPNDGTLYKGGILNHKRTDVEGIVYDPETKDVYISSWENNSPNGKGMMIISDSNPDRNIAKCPGARFYVGEWKNGKKHGKGRCYDATGKMMYNGEFEDGMPVDEFPGAVYYNVLSDSTFKYAITNDSTFYLGEMVDGQRNGLGVHVNGGDIIYSTWKNNQADGQVVYIPHKGYHALLTFRNGKPVVDDRFVELGLPSGTNWAKSTCVRGFYTHEEALMVTHIDPNRELPSVDHWWELKTCCQWERKDGYYIVTGPNGNSIIIDGYEIIHEYSGVRKPKSKTYNFWSSTGIDDESAWSFECNKDKLKMALSPLKSKLAIHWIMK